MTIPTARDTSTTARGRTLQIEALDGSGRPAAANVELSLDGRFAGGLEIGATGRATLELAGWSVLEIALRATFFGETLQLQIAPNQDAVSIRFSHIVRFAIARTALAYCPDGSSGSPCVTCREQGATWRMCC